MLIRFLIESGLKKLGEQTTSAPLTVIERVILHALYLIPVLIAIGISASRFMLPYPAITGHGFTIGEIITTTVGIAAFTVLFSIWNIVYRKVKIEPWAVTHLIWVSHAYVSLALHTLIAGISFAVFIILAVIINQIAPILFYVGIAMVYLVTILFLWRLAKGYYHLVQSKPIDSVKRLWTVKKINYI